MMSEIDVIKCDYYRYGECYRYDFPMSCAKCSDCYYKQLQQLKQECDLYKTWYRAKHNDLKNYLGQLKAENEGLQSLNDFNVQKIETLEAENEKYKQCLDEIEEICKDNFCIFADGVCDGLGGEILQKIKQAKEGKENEKM